MQRRHLPEELAAIHRPRREAHQHRQGPRRLQPAEDGPQELGRLLNDEGGVRALPGPVHAVRGLQAQRPGDVAHQQVRQGRTDPEGSEAKAQGGADRCGDAAPD